MGTGRQVTDAQVKEVRLNLNQGGSLRLAAMKAGMDRKTARKYRDLGQLPSATSTAPRGRRRPDPLVNVWARLEQLLQREPGLHAKTLVEWLQQQCPGQDWQRQRRAGGRGGREGKGGDGPG